MGRLWAWLIENCLYLAVLIAVVWVGITRWNGRPAKPHQPGDGLITPVRLRPANDRTDELVKAIDALPRTPWFELPAAPAGWTWTLNTRRQTVVGDALHGQWTPEVRRNLRAALDFVLSPEVEAVLSQLEAIEPGAWRGGPGDRPVGRSLQRLGYAAVLFAVRARYYSEAVSDYDAALADLASVYKLAGYNYNADSFETINSGMSCERLAHVELRRLVRRHLLSRDQHTKMRTALAGAGPSYPDLWNLAIGRKIAAMQGVLDGGFTDSKDESGFLAINHLHRLSRPRWAQKKRSGIWNVFSVVFNGRAVVAQKVDQRTQAYRDLSELSFADSRRALTELRAQNPFNITDGPICGARQAILIWSLAPDQIASHLAVRHATLLAMALSVNRAQTGQYPASLADLDQADLLPMDPYSGQPFRYARQADSGFVLYALGPNLTDNGGRPHQVDEKTGVTALDGDICFHLPRPQALHEPELIETHK